ncbi:MAG: GerMN domain-containing protein, partial [Desulfitobacterium sp.]|nr:GerMN domain-containing protein [Desulfitobacterium sp.]
MVKGKLRNLLAFTLVLLLGLGLVGCGSKNVSQVESPVSEPSSEISEVDLEDSDSEEPVHNEVEVEKSTITTTLYFPTADASGLRSVNRGLNFDESEPSIEKIVMAMFEELFTPGDGLVEVLPNGTKLLNVTVK